MLKKIREALKKSLRKNEKGFTLIELLVVVVILGILAVVIVPKFTTNITNARTSVDQANITIIESAAERYKIEKDSSSYPSIATLVTDGFLKETPKAANDDKAYSVNSTTGKVTIVDK